MSPAAALFRHAIVSLAALATAVCAAPGDVTPQRDNLDRPSRPRVVVLTDFFKDPDDKQSMIRLLACANEFEIEGLIATSLAYGDGSVRPELILGLLNQYAAVFPSLRRHERPGFEYPAPEFLATRVKAGAPVVRQLVGTAKGFPVPYPTGSRDSRMCDPAEKWIGAGKDTPGSEHIIRVVDRDDPRPVWVLVWGGAMDLAQALWKVRHERPRSAVDRFVQKLRVYQVSWQDTGAVWLWHEFPNLFRIQCSVAMRGMYMERTSSAGTEAWVNENVRHAHGPLGAAYPKAGATDGVKEGDSPSFLHLLAPGLSDPERPDWGGWGGRFRRLDAAREVYVDTADDRPSSAPLDRRERWTVARWSEAVAHDFAARMDWCVRAPAEANHPPVIHLDGVPPRGVLRRVLKVGERLTLDASGSHDPDGNPLTYQWWQYREAGTYDGMAPIEGANTAKASIVAPSVNRSTSLHVILQLTDQGSPPLTSYQRLVLEVQP